MVSFYKAPARRSFDRSAFELECTDLDLKGRGLGRARDAVWFVKELIPGEIARVQPLNLKGTAGEARIIKLLKRSPERLEDACPYAASCGGCPLSHLPPEMSLKAKTDGVRRLFAKQLKLELPEPDFSEESPQEGYRRACRLAVRFDHGALHLGFRKELSKELCDIQNCLVLTPRLNALLPSLKGALSALSCRGRIGHCELLDSDKAAGAALRLTEELPAEDERKLAAFADEHNLVLSVQESYKETLGTDDSVKVRERLIAGDPEDLYITSAGIRIRCLPTSFAQVNAHINAAMVKRVLELINPKAGMQVLDLFCGLGNFTLPLARAGATVAGVDVVPPMTALASENAAAAGISTASFVTADLEEPFEKLPFAKAGCDAAVLDPGRSGAKRSSLWVARRRIPKVLMISCNPLAASRDLAAFRDQGYQISKWGIFDMFPRTSHVETAFVLERK